jgi:hypothetical protein
MKKIVKIILIIYLAIGTINYLISFNIMGLLNWYIQIAIWFLIITLGIWVYKKIKKKN